MDAHPGVRRRERYSRRLCTSHETGAGGSGKLAVQGAGGRHLPQVQVTQNRHRGALPVTHEKHRTPLPRDPGRKYTEPAAQGHIQDKPKSRASLQKNWLALFQKGQGRDGQTRTEGLFSTREAEEKPLRATAPARYRARHRFGLLCSRGHYCDNRCNPNSPQVTEQNIKVTFLILLTAPWIRKRNPSFFENRHKYSRVKAYLVHNLPLNGSGKQNQAKRVYTQKQDAKRAGEDANVGGSG